MMKLSHTKILALVVCSTALLSCIAYVLFFLTIKKTNTEISLLQNELDTELQTEERLHSVKQLLADLGYQIRTLDSHFVPGDGVVRFLEQLEKLGRTTGATVKVNAVSADDRAGSVPSIEWLRVEFVSKGSWRAVTQLLSLLETLPYSITIERTQLERIPQSSEWQLYINFLVAKLK